MTEYLRQAFRERRCIAIIALFAFAALLVFNHLAPHPALTQRWEFVLAAAASLALPLLTVPFPRVRTLVMSLAFAGFAVAVLALGLLAVAEPAARTWVLILAVWLGVFWISHQFLTGTWPKSLTARVSPCFKAQAVSAVDARTLWNALVPSPEHPETYCDDAVTAIDHVSPGEGIGRLTRETPEGEDSIIYQNLEVEPPYHARIRVISATAQVDDGVLGDIELFVVDLGDKRMVLVRHEPGERTLNAWIREWLDDTLGQELDRRLSVVERRARAAGATLTPVQTPR